MKIDDYAQQAITTLSSDYAYGDANAQLMGMVLGLGGESGEVLEKFKKLLRDQQGTITETDKQAIIKELGDILWYVTAVRTCLARVLRRLLSATTPSSPAASSVVNCGVAGMTGRLCGLRML